MTHELESNVLLSCSRKSYVTNIEIVLDRFYETK